MSVAVANVPRPQSKSVRRGSRPQGGGSGLQGGSVHGAAGSRLQQQVLAATRQGSRRPHQDGQGPVCCQGWSSMGCVH